MFYILSRLMVSFTMIVPAYNEEACIVQTIQLLLPLVGKELERLIIVDDASSDATPKLLEQFRSLEGITLLYNVRNLGKSAAVARAIREVKSSHVVLLDADLRYLDQKAILELLAPIQHGQASVSMAFLKNGRPLFPFKKIDYCSGQRVLPIGLFDGQLSSMEQLPSYGLEVFINQLMIAQQTPLCIVQRERVENTFHHSSYGWWIGRRKNLRIWWHILKIAGGLRAIYAMNFALEKLLVEYQD